MTEQSAPSLQDLPIGISDWEYIQGKNLFFVDKSAKASPTGNISKGKISSLSTNLRRF